MVWALLLTALAQETLTEGLESSDIAVFHYGIDPILSAKISVNYVQAISDYSSKDLNPVMMDDVFPLEKSLVRGVESERCLGYPVSPLRFAKTIQEIDYALSYFELEKAKSLISSAEASLICLSEPPKVDVVADLLFFAAITYFYEENVILAKQYFSRAIAYKPNLDWNEMFEPAAKDLFQEARKEYAQLHNVPLRVFPDSAKSMLWVNGVPVLRDAPLTLTEGKNHVQIVGSSIENLLISVQKDTLEVEMVVPSAINEVGLTWLERPEKRTEIGEVLHVLYPEDPSYFVSSSEYIWMYEPQSSKWIEHLVPVSAKVFSLDTRRTVGKALYWGGLSLTAVCGGIAVQDYAQLSTLATSSSDAWTEMNADYEQFQTVEATYKQNAQMTLISFGVTGLGWLMSR